MPIKICIHHMATWYCWELEGQHRELSFETKPPVPTTWDLIRWQCCRTLAYNKFYAILQGIPNCQTHVGHRQMPHTIPVYKPACILSNNSARFGNRLQDCVHTLQCGCIRMEVQPSLDEDQEDGSLWIPTTFRGGFR